MKKPHLIEIFSANCPLCKHIIDDIQIGKCELCNQIVYDVNNITEDVRLKMKKYSVKAVPTRVLLMEKLKLLVFLIFLGYVETIYIRN